MRLSESRSPKPKISLTPLIDVVFLLLIFFMLASTFLKFNAMAISAVERGPAAADVSKFVLIEILGEQRLEVNGATLQVDGLLAHIDRLVANGLTRAVVKPTPNATVQDLVSVLERARRSKLTSVVIVR